MCRVGVGSQAALRLGVYVRALAQQLVGEGNPREKVSYYSSADWAEQVLV